MSRRTNARLAGFVFLFYIAVGIPDLQVFGTATGGEGTAERLIRLSHHALEARIASLLGLAESFSALLLAVTLYALTKDEDHDIAMLGLCCRVGEGVIGGVGTPRTLALLSLSMSGTATGASFDNARIVLGSSFLDARSPGAIFFAVGSTCFSYLLLRGRMIPRPLAWLGLVPLQRFRRWTSRQNVEDANGAGVPVVDAPSVLERASTTWTDAQTALPVTAERGRYFTTIIFRLVVPSSVARRHRYMPVGTRRPASSVPSQGTS